MSDHRCTATYVVHDRRTGKEIVLQCALNDGHSDTHYANEGRLTKEWEDKDGG